jgi:lysyl-tRNA synthetase class 2
MDLEFLQLRAKVFRTIRAFFDSKSYLEVDTPVLAPDLIPETCLEVFETSCLRPEKGGLSVNPYWLVPSPEIWMKRLIAKHKKSVYQICKCFRNGESTGFLHSPEFTMLEYYTVNFNYLDSLKLTEELFDTLFGVFADGAETPGGGLKPPFLRITMEEAFREFAGVDLFAAVETGTLPKAAKHLGLDPPAGLDTAALYDLIFIHAVEPKLPKDRITALLDYPAFVPCLAKRNDNGNGSNNGNGNGNGSNNGNGNDNAGGKTVERWELYGCGVELANCYTEETDAETVKAYFEAEGEAKDKTALVPHKTDKNYWKVFADFPACSGVAMGLDRLIMVLSGRKTIDGVLPFPMGPGAADL